MRFLPWAAAVLISSCAEVPAGICFSYEPCADAGSAGGGNGGGTNTGGGNTGGGNTGGGNTGGGNTGGGNTGGGNTGGGGGPPVPNVFFSLNIADTWAELLAGIPAQTTEAPAFSPLDVVIDGGTVPTQGCPEVFRGAVALPDGRALVIPFCANRFAVVNPTSATAHWLDPTLVESHLLPDPGHFAGGVLGCDGRVYVLPYHDQRQVKRITVTDAGFAFDDLPLSIPGPHFLSGGVIARPCSSGFRIIAAGAEGLYALDPTETEVTITPIIVAGSAVRFNGVARLGDAEVISATPVGVNLLTVRVDSNTLLSTSTQSLLLEPHLGIATRRTGDAFVVTHTGVGYPILDGGPGPTRTLAAARQRWPTNSGAGWVFTVGQELLAWNEAPPPLDGGIVFDPATSDFADATSGGLLMTPSGVLVNVPGASQRPNVITLYQPTGSPLPPGETVLSPWFNKL